MSDDKLRRVSLLLHMLTPDEEKFLEYWQHNRDREKRTFRQLLIGLPLGLSFAVAIVAIFSSGWYERANMVAYGGSSPLVFLLAIVLIIGFIAIFSKKHQWDMKEQQYRELLYKKGKERPDAADNGNDQSINQAKHNTSK